MLYRVCLHYCSLNIQWENTEEPKSLKLYSYISGIRLDSTTMWAWTTCGRTLTRLRHLSKLNSLLLCESTFSEWEQPTGYGLFAIAHNISYKSNWKVSTELNNMAKINKSRVEINWLVVKDWRSVRRILSCTVIIITEARGSNQPRETCGSFSKYRETIMYFCCCNSI